MPPPTFRAPGSKLTRLPSGPTVLVLTADPLLARHLLSVVAAVGLEAVQPGTHDDLRRTWRSAGAALVGHDSADRLDELGLAPRSQLFVVGRDDERPETYACSTRLRAAVATLPAGGPDLASALSLLVPGTTQGKVLAVSGGSGGVGTSTLAAALAVCGARSGLRTLLLDADLGGGGIDILLGAEGLAGWRWGRFEAARGHLGDLRGQLPHCDGVDVLAVDRPAPAGITLRAEPLTAVLDSTSRSHDLTVVDLPRHLDVVAEKVLRRAGSTLLLVRADVRGVVAAQHAALALVPRCRELEVVVRTGREHALDPVLVADTLDLPLAGVLEEDHAVPLAAGQGEPPGRSARSPLARLCTSLLRERIEVAA